MCVYEPTSAVIMPRVDSAHTPLSVRSVSSPHPLVCESLNAPQCHVYKRSPPKRRLVDADVSAHYASSPWQRLAASPCVMRSLETSSQPFRSEPHMVCSRKNPVCQRRRMVSIPPSVEERVCHRWWEDSGQRLTCLSI